MRSVESLSESERISLQTILLKECTDNSIVLALESDVLEYVKNLIISDIHGSEESIIKMKTASQMGINFDQIETD